MVQAEPNAPERLSKLGSILVTALVTALLAAGGMIVTVRGEMPSRTEVLGMIEAQSPYVRDQGMILYRMKEIERRLKIIDGKVDGLHDQIKAVVR